jgi:hypothetical protein
MRHTASILGCLAGGIAASAALAQPFEISWYTIDGGGGTSSGGSFTLSGTIGQHDAGVLSGGSFTVYGGFWYPGVAAPPACDGDLNQDGTVDQGDVDCMINIVAGDPSCLALSGFDSDFNHDGNVDQDDVDSFIGFVAGGPCP